MALHEPKFFISMGTGHDAGFAEVPEERPIRNDSGAFAFGMLIPGICMSACACKSVFARNTSARQQAGFAIIPSSVSPAARGGSLNAQGGFGPGWNVGELRDAVWRRDAVALHD